MPTSAPDALLAAADAADAATVVAATAVAAPDDPAAARVVVTTAVGEAVEAAMDEAEAAMDEAEAAIDEADAAIAEPEPLPPATTAPFWGSWVAQGIILQACCAVASLVFLTQSARYWRHMKYGIVCW